MVCIHFGVCSNAVGWGVCYKSEQGIRPDQIKIHKYALIIHKFHCSIAADGHETNLFTLTCKI